MQVRPLGEEKKTGEKTEKENRNKNKQYCKKVESVRNLEAEQLPITTVEEKKNVCCMRPIMLPRISRLL